MSGALRRALASMGRGEAVALVALTVACWPASSRFRPIRTTTRSTRCCGGADLDGRLPSFDAYRAPTQHPLWVALCVPLAALGDGSDRVLLAICVLSFVGLVAGMYTLGKQVFGTVVGVVAALLLASRLDFPFLAARGYIDVPYMALVVWAAALEVARPRRGGAVWVLLTLAGLLRPEAWVLAGIYALWVVWERPWRCGCGRARWWRSRP